MKEKIKKILTKLSARKIDSSTDNKIDVLQQIAIDDYRQTHLFNNPKYSKSSGRLNYAEFQVYSQNGEDGIINEIFSRIGTTNKFFVEFGVGDGLTNNTAYLLLKEWRGLWIEASKRSIEKIKNTHEIFMKSKHLTLCQSFVTVENIERLLGQNNVPKEIDLISIDIDSNDLWIWKSIEEFSPRVVVIEYNAKIPPNHSWTVKYDDSRVWKQDMFMGASLKALEELGEEKGYKLVCCDFNGVNAFFVRKDLLGQDAFLMEMTSKNLYETPKYFLIRQFGHKNAFDSF